MGALVFLRKRCPACSGKGRNWLEAMGIDLYGPACSVCHGAGLISVRAAADWERDQKAKSLPSDCLP